MKDGNQYKYNAYRYKRWFLGFAYCRAVRKQVVAVQVKLIEVTAPQLNELEFSEDLCIVMCDMIIN